MTNNLIRSTYETPFHKCRRIWSKVKNRFSILCTLMSALKIWCCNMTSFIASYKSIWIKFFQEIEALHIIQCIIYISQISLSYLNSISIVQNDTKFNNYSFNYTIGIIWRTKIIGKVAYCGRTQVSTNFILIMVQVCVTILMKGLKRTRRDAIFFLIETNGLHEWSKTS